MRNNRPHHINVDRIVLPPGTIGTRRVRAAIERELARLLSETPMQMGASLPAASVKVEAGADAEAIGVAVARQIHAGLK